MMRMVKIAAVCLSGMAFSSVAGAADLEYNRDIRPILADNCFRCHGPDSASRKADLRLDQREGAIASGAIVAGKPAESAVIERIFSDDPQTKMPPPATHKELSVEQKERLRRWITEGATYQLHWSLLPPHRPELPAVKQIGWVRNPIDRFILAKLEAVGLAPAAEADRRTLVRRLSLDLTGLPPEPAVVEAFVNDPAADAYEALVDRLLNSEQWGEHRARYWLDAARYADTHGIHFDNYREMWAYRDWVIGAFNRNLSFDRFTIEQLAGDLLPARTLDQQIASGFNRCNITTNEGGVIPEEYAVLYTRDRTETAAQIWLGMTAGCAVCHDHKFDPLSQREFYEMAAFFNNSTQPVMDGNIKNPPPVIMVPTIEDRRERESLIARRDEAKRQLEARQQTARADYDRWVASEKKEGLGPMVPTEGLLLHVALNEEPGKSLKASLAGKPRELPIQGEVAWEPGHTSKKAYKSRPGQLVSIPEAGNFDIKDSFTCAVWVKLPKDGMNGSVIARMDENKGHRGWDMWIENNRFAMHLINRWPNNALKVVSRSQLKPGEWTHLAITYDGSAKAEGIRLYKNGAPEEVDVAANKLRGTCRIAVPLTLAQRHVGARLDDVAFEDVRLYGRALTGGEASRLVGATRAEFLAHKPAKERTAAENDELYRWWLLVLDREYRGLSETITRLEDSEVAIRNRSPSTHVMQERTEPAMAFVLYRGEYDKRRDSVRPNTPAVLPAFPKYAPRNRLGLAEWLLRPEHPLTARVTVNRFWQEAFGTGIVRTAGDFGISGELPSHPELLDWLAVDFRESGWDIKRFFKQMVMSATYRQASAATPEKLAKDPHNRLLSRGPRFRMDAEMVRDYALAASGLLSRRIGGPSVRPYQPEGVWEAVAMIGSDTRNYRMDKGENLYRRGLYTFWKRAAPPAALEIFNAPNRETCTVKRERTNTPLQALVTLNDPQFVEAARRLAERALIEAVPTDSDRIDYLAHRLLARPFTAPEKEIVSASLRDLAVHYRAEPESARKLIAVGESKPAAGLEVASLATWTMLTNQLMNLDEVLCK